VSDGRDVIKKFVTEWGKSVINSSFKEISGLTNHMQLGGTQKKASTQAASSTKGLVTFMKNLSFLWLSLGLMGFGLCFFLAGFFLGLWLDSPSMFTEKDFKVAENMSRQIGHRHVSSHHPRVITTTPSAATRVAVNSAGAGSVTQESGSHTDAPSTAKPQTPKYTIQLGTFVTSSNAYALKKQLEHEHIHTRVVTTQDQNSGPLFNVQTGEFHSFQEAQTYAESLGTDQQFSAVIVPLKAPPKK
jgi:cell division septation protein DedD